MSENRISIHYIHQPDFDFKNVQSFFLVRSFHTFNRLVSTSELFEVFVDRFFWYNPVLFA